MTVNEASKCGALRALVQEYRVLWTILPKRLPKSMNGHRIGFEIELWGTHSHPIETGTGECFDCRRMLDLLEEVAIHVAPGECIYRETCGTPVGSRSHLHPRDGFGRSVCLGFEVVCRGGYAAVAEQCDAGCLPGIRERLLSIGARPI